MNPHQAVERLLGDRIGLDPSSVGEGLITRGVHARMLAVGCKTLDDYQWLLAHSGVEVQALIEEVVIPESWFFRDARPFETLAEHVRAGWVLDVSRPSLKVLSLPCAGGEEPYSIAMTLIDAGLPPDRFRIDAVDVSERALARGIAGVYGPNSFRGVALAARARHFREERGRFTVDTSLRTTVRFHLGNLLDPGLFKDRPPFDVVFCRNLLIYFDQAARLKAFASLDRLLTDGGLLFLGHADRANDSIDSRFRPSLEKGSFAHRKQELGWVNPAQRSKPQVPFEKPQPKPAVPPKPAPDRPKVTKETSTSSTVEPLEATDSLLDRASSLADLGRYIEASDLVEQAVARGLASPEAHFLLGLIRQASGDQQAAEAQFLKVLYLNAQHDEALLALAALSHRKGDVAAEATYRRRAGRVLARKATS